MKKVKFMAMLLAATAMSVNFTACSDDDENEGDGGGSGTGTGLSIVPPSIVDGMCVAGITTSDNNSAISVDYNDDGSINSATMQGLTYNFEYSESRANKKLIRIKADIKYSDEGDEAEYNWVAENFVEGANGFVISYTSKVNYSESYETEEYSATGTAEFNAKFTYNAEGRVTSMKQTGTESYTDTEDGSVSGDVDFAFEYSYNSGMLIS